MISIDINNIEEAFPEVIYKKLLAHYMKEQGITTLAYSGYTPYFNDGDVCEPIVEYFGVPNFSSGDYVPYIDRRGNIDTFYYDDIRFLDDIKDDISEEDYKHFSQYIDKDGVPEYNYPIENFQSWLFAIAPTILETNTYATIHLKENGELDIITTPNTDHD